MADNKLTEDDEELVIVETPPPGEKDDKADGKADDKAEDKADKTDDEADDKDEHDDDDDQEEGDERLAESQDDEEMSPNRKRRLKRREMRKRAKENADRELAFLREQNAEFARRLSAVEGHALTSNVQSLDQRINDAMRDAQQAEQIMARAVEAGNGDDVATALRLRDEARQRAAQLFQSKQQVENFQKQKDVPTVDPRVRTLAQEWVAANPWYDPNGRDEDSRITKAIDDGLVAEGYNPASPDYWHELTRRVSARLGGDEDDSPQPAKREAAPQPAKRKAPPTGTNREHAPPSTRKEVYVTPERKQAMIDAGVWDDPALRTRYLKAYHAYDKNSAR